MNTNRAKVRLYDIGDCLYRRVSSVQAWASDDAEQAGITGEVIQMIVSKGDKVRTVSGDTGEVLETWGRARTFLSLKRDSDGRSIPMFESKVVEILQHASAKKRGRGWG